MSRSPDFFVSPMANAPKNNSVYIAGAVIGVALFALTLFYSIEARRTEQWPVVHGTIKSSDYHNVTYDYVIDGQGYESAATSYVSFINPRFDNCESLRDQKTIMVHYNPKRPEQAVVKTGVPPILLLALASSAALGLISIFAIASGFETISPTYDPRWDPNF